MSTKTTLERLTEQQKNVLKAYLEATDLQLLNGRLWYSIALEVCQMLAKRYCIDLLTVACVMAVLSPAASWESNIKFCGKLLSDNNNECVKVEDGAYTVYKTNAYKALKIIEDDTVRDEWYNQDLDTMRAGHKTLSFAHNIMGNEYDYVTIDRHAYRVWKCGLDNVEMKIPSLTKNQYKKISNDYKVVADFLGISASTLQAVTWLVMREYLSPVAAEKEVYDRINSIP
jgi:hypothetical protein